MVLFSPHFPSVEESGLGVGTKPGDALLRLRTRSCSFKGLNDFSSGNLKWKKIALIS